MRSSSAQMFTASRSLRDQASRKLNSAPIVKIANGTFYRQHPQSQPVHDAHVLANPPLFPDLTVSIPFTSTPNEHWAVLSPSSNIRTAFLQILRGQLLCFPPTARTFPFLLTPELVESKSKLRYPEQAIEYVGFDVQRQAFGGAYLSARYESLKEESDFTLQRYLTGITTLNPGEEELKAKMVDENLTRKVMKELELERFLQKPVAMLSNGQSRRARIGKALLTQPLVLCLDAPFIGLDPIVTKHISSVLHRLAEANAPRVVLSLRPQDTIPEWITHLVYAGEDGKVDVLGLKEKVFSHLQMQYKHVEKLGWKGELSPKQFETREVGRHLSEGGNFGQRIAPTHDTHESEPQELCLSRDGHEKIDKHTNPIGEAVVEMDGVRIAYGPNSVLGDWEQNISGTYKKGLHFSIHRGQRWGIFGPNGSGKTTLLSLVLSDHPQTYSAPVKIFGRSRLPEPGVPGITIFEIQARMGHASPEVHALFPKWLSVRKALESAWSDTPITTPNLTTNANARIDACVAWFENELNPLHLQGDNTTPDQSSCPSSISYATHTLFGELSYSSQRVLLFLRAVISNPDILILDEAFSGMDDMARDKCLLFLSRGETMQLRYTDAGPKPFRREGIVSVPGLQDHQALLCVSHSKLEVPGCVRDWICLPEAGKGAARFGRWDGPVELDGTRWERVWEEDV